MGIAHQSSDPLLINLYVSKDARHWSSIHDGMTIKRLSQVSQGCPADVMYHICAIVLRDHFKLCNMLQTDDIYIYIYMYMFWITFENNSWTLISFLLYVFLCKCDFKKKQKRAMNSPPGAERRTNHKESPFSAFMWECAPLTAQTAERRWCRACRGWLGVVFGSKSCWIIRLNPLITGVN